MKKVLKRVFLMSVLVLSSLMIGKTTEVLADVAVPQDIDETYDSPWLGTLDISENKTIKLKDISYSTDGTDYSSPIRIKGGATVNILFEGDNVLTGNSGVISAGIEVENGSTVNIYGMDNSTLTVTGGKYSAGIGGIGYNATSENNPSAGNVIIYSGNITAIGGNRGAGIGSGYHSSASDIRIYGGNVTALGMGFGAGIGSGYGTSGGALLASKVGYYNGGNITISGGIVRAAGWNADFDNLDIYNPESMYNSQYSDTFAAGIGGGYGASSGNIVIEGNACVYALGNCGGAGIGTGRGTNKVANFDSAHADCNVVIRGNACVYALAGEDRRDNMGFASGAGIGLGRAWSLTENTCGSVRIEDNANVYAYAENGANGIGASVIVGKFTTSEDGKTVPPGNAHLSTFSIADGATVVAICDKGGYRDGFDNESDDIDSNVTNIDFSNTPLQEAAFEDGTAFFNSSMFPLKLVAKSVADPDINLSFPARADVNFSVAIHMPLHTKDSGYVVTVDGYKSNDVNVLLTNTSEDRNWIFDGGKKYEIADLQLEELGIKYNLNGGKNNSSNKASYSILKTPIKLYEPTKSGYTFDGWYDNSSFTGDKVTSISDTCNTAIELWAKWTKKQETKKEDTKDDKDDSDTTKDTSNSILIAKMIAKGSKSMVISWNKVKDAAGYDIYFVKCDDKSEKAKLKKVKTVSGNKTFSWTKSGLKKQKSYKCYVKAWKKVSDKKKYIAESPVVHAYTSGYTKKYTNPKSIVLKKTAVSIKKGKSYTIKATVNKVNKKKKLMPSGHEASLRYISDNTKIATVNSKGKVKGKAKGSCTIYVYAVNGVSAKLKVTVK